MASTDAIFSAIDAGDVDAVRSLVAREPALASARDAEGVSALLRARYRFDRGLTEAIRAAGAALDVHEAAAFGDLDRLAALLADPAGASALSGDGFTPLHLAAFFGQRDTVRLLLDRGAEVDAPGRGWMTGTPLHSATSRRHAEIVDLLLEAGADPNARQSGGWTPMHSAAHNGDARSVTLLLAKGGDPSAVNDDGASVLFLAEERGDAATVAAVRAAGGGLIQAP